MKIVYFTKYTQAGPSSRYRSFQYFPYFEKEGIEITCKPFFTTDYLKTFYSKGKKSIPGIIPRFILRFLQVLFLKKYDIIFIEYELFPFTPLFIERWLLKGKKNIILEYDDAVFHTYDNSSSKLVRWICGNKIYKLVALAQVVITGSPYLTQKLMPFANRIEEIPTSIEFEKYDNNLLSKENKENGFLRIGWIGSKTTSSNVLSIKQVFINLQKQYKIQLVLVGFDKQLLPALEGVNYEYNEWRENTEIGLIRSFDAGIMPLDDTGFNNGKCGFKLIQYMACGLPTISTPLIANLKINKHKTNLHATTPLEWEAALIEIITHKDYYKNKVGTANKALIKTSYSVENNYTDYIAIFRSMII